jgi:hypothetical protein
MKTLQDFLHTVGDGLAVAYVLLTVLAVIGPLFGMSKDTSDRIKGAALDLSKVRGAKADPATQTGSADTQSGSAVAAPPPAAPTTDPAPPPVDEGS